MRGSVCVWWVEGGVRSFVLCPLVTDPHCPFESPRWHQTIHSYTYEHTYEHLQVLSLLGIKALFFQPFQIFPESSKTTHLRAILK